MPRLTQYGDDLLLAVELLTNSTPDDALGLIKKISKGSRGEFGVEPKAFFSNSDFIHKLLNIGTKYVSDEKIVEEVLLTLSLIVKRCDIKPQNIYDFLFAHIGTPNKKCQRHIAYALPFFPQFDEYEKKWEYILSIPKIPPKKDMISVFRWVIEHNEPNIPDHIKGLVISILENFINSNTLVSTTHNLYAVLIDKLKA